MAKDGSEDYKSIKVYESTYERLQKHGNMNESFDELINRILDNFEDDKNTNE